MKSMVVSSLTVILAGQLVVAAGQQRDQAQRELRAAMNMVLVDGDLPAAIELFKAIAVRYEKTNRQVAATAVLQLAECYQKRGDSSEAQKIYERLVRDFADQKDIVTTAQARLGNIAAPTGIVARQLWPGDASGQQASLSPDGRFVVTHDLREISTGRLTKVLPDYDPARGVGNEEWPILSKDSNQLAYARYTGGVYEVRVSPAELGAKPRTVLRNPEFSYYVLADWAPDGKSILSIIATAGRNAQLAWISVADGTVQTLKSLEWRNPGLARLSPDGRFIAYDALVKQGAADREIRIIAADASRESVVVGGPGDNALPVWTRDGSRLVFVSKRSGTAALWSIPVREGKADGPAELVRPNMAAIRPLGFSNTGSFLYVQQLGNQNVFVQQLDRTSGKAVGDPQTLVDTYVGANQSPSWSPDGKSIAYISRRVEPTNQNSPATLIIRSVESGQETAIPTTFTYPGQPHWFPDGQSILQVARNNQNTTCFFKVEVRTGAVRELVNTGSGLPPGSALSPDGDTVYVRHPQKFDTIAAYDLATGLQTVIPGPSLEGPFPAIAPSPDGRRLVYPARASSGNLRLHVVTHDGGNARDLFAAYPQKGYITGLAWTPDSQSIYVVLSDSASVRGYRSQLWRVRGDGGAPEFTGLSASTMRAISLNPDGTRLIFGGGELVRSEYWSLDNIDRAWRTSPQKSSAGR